jgi:hypothetical protein
VEVLVNFLSHAIAGSFHQLLVEDCFDDDDDDDDDDIVMINASHKVVVVVVVVVVDDDVTNKTMIVSIFVLQLALRM